MTKYDGDCYINTVGGTGHGGRGGDGGMGRRRIECDDKHSVQNFVDSSQIKPHPYIS